MYDDKQYPYRCPICLTRPSLCTEDAVTGLKTVGCLTNSCPAPLFVEPTEGHGEKRYYKYHPLISWDNWVIKYREEHPDWHREAVCKSCLRYKKDEICKYYEEDMFRCPRAEYRRI